MKNIMKLIILPCISLLICSCASFLDEKDPTGIQEPYSTEAQLEASLQGILSASNGGWLGNFCQGFGHASVIVCNSIMTPSMVNGTMETAARNLTQYSTESGLNDLFMYCYKAIYSANYLIAKLKESPVEQSYKLEVEAEAKFYRAVFYFVAVRVFGDIPLRLTSTSPEDAANIGRTPYYEVYAQIVRDLQFAEMNMRTPERVAEVSPTSTRPCRYASTAYLSSVYTHIGSLLSHPDDNFWDPSKKGRSPNFSSIGITSAKDAYSKALEYAEKLIPESGKQIPGCKYALVEKFTDLFQFTPSFSRNGYNAWRNPEQVFSLSITGSSGNSTTIARLTLPTFCEGTKESIKHTNAGYVRPHRYVLQKWSRTYGGAKYNDYIYKSCYDPRYAGSYFYKEMAPNEYAQALGQTNIKYIYPCQNTKTDNAGFAYFRKYWSSEFDGTNSFSDIYLMRFAEVYLNAAEAAAFLGNETLARKYIEVLHKRARHSVEDGKPDASVPTWDGVTFADKEEMITAIFWERVFELGGENHEYFDTHRFGAEWLVENITKPVNSFNAESQQSFLHQEHGGSMYMFPTGFKYTEDPQIARKALIAPYPSMEYLYNKAITDRLNDYDYGI